MARNASALRREARRLADEGLTDYESCQPFIYGNKLLFSAKRFANS